MICIPPSEIQTLRDVSKFRFIFFSGCLCPLEHALFMFFEHPIEQKLLALVLNPVMVSVEWNVWIWNSFIKLNWIESSHAFILSINHLVREKNHPKEFFFLSRFYVLFEHCYFVLEAQYFIVSAVIKLCVAKVALLVAGDMIRRLNALLARHSKSIFDFLSQCLSLLLGDFWILTRV